MIEIQAANLAKSFEVGQTLLDGLTFQIEQGEHVGILGRNGAGKSTLFRLLTGELDRDFGQLAIAPGRRVGLISQIPIYPAGYTVEDVLRSAFARLDKIAAELRQLESRMEAGEADNALLRRYDALSERFARFGGYDTDVSVNKIVQGLSIPEEQRRQLFESLSGGEKTRVNLGRLILEDTDILLLDEPTNHLDLHASEWLEEYVNGFRGTVLTISHDRYFLDRTVKRIIEIEDGKASFYSGNYSFYAVEKERRYQEQLRRYQREKAEIDRLSETARKMHEHNTELLHRRAFSIEKRIERMRTTTRPVKRRKLNARFHAVEFHGDEVLSIRKLSKSYGVRELFTDISLKIEGGERIALIGDNGAGKSTLLKIIMGETPPDTGRIRLGPQTRTAYLPQLVEFEHPDWNLVDSLIAVKRNLSAPSARNRLAQYDFTGEDVFKPVSVLSGGEQSRLRLCMLMDGDINLLILDEPTNHLDIASREWIEDAVEDYDGALLFVSHDRYFINRFATRIWELADGTITDYPMGFAQYREEKAREEAERQEAAKNGTSPASGPSDKRKGKTGDSGKPAAPGKQSGRQCEHSNGQADGTQSAAGGKLDRPSGGGRQQQSARRRLTICEREIAKAEARLSALEAEMEAAATDYVKLTELTAEQASVQEELETLYSQWEQLSEEAGE